MKNINDIILQFETGSIPYGALYILPDGRTLDLSMFENGHADFWAIINSSAEELKAAGWLRANTVMKYIELPTMPTEQQQERLNDLFEIFGEGFQIK